MTDEQKIDKFLYSGELYIQENIYEGITGYDEDFQISYGKIKVNDEP